MFDKKNNKKVIQFPNNQGSKQGVDGKTKSSTGNFDGFEYVKMEQDLNGSPFIKENLVDYARDCKYMVRVMREKDSKILLYNYYVSQDRLSYFLSKVDSKEIDGQVIEIEKYIPEDLA